MTVRVRVVVDGLVQGVFFRDSCRREAARHRVQGWVRNCADGRVEAVFEGERDAVGALVEWCRAGPPRAHVTSVAINDEAPQGERDFRVR
jgi:acylphosphatase